MKNRVDIIYDIYTHLYREPQKIDCIRKTDKKFKNEEDMINNLRRLEVPLNHILNVFFLSLSYNQTNGLFRNIIKKECDDNYNLLVRDISEFVDISQIKNPTQPDLLFIGEKNIISIELKVQSKSDYSQILKYALLHYLEGKKSKIYKSHNLILIGKGSFSNFWKEKHITEENLKDECRKNIENIEKKYHVYKNEIINMIDQINIIYISYTGLVNILENEIFQEDKRTQDLYNGLINELEERKLSI